MHLRKLLLWEPTRHIISDRVFGGSDTWATAIILKNAIEYVAKDGGVDIVFCGRQAIDGDTAQVGPQIAEHLDLPQVSYVEKIDYDGNSKLRIRKATEEGYQMVEVSTPCLLTVLSAAADARYMSVNGIVDAYGKEVEIWDASKIDVDESKLGLNGSPTRVFKSFTKGAKAAGQIYEVDPQEAVNIIVEKLKEKFII